MNWNSRMFDFHSLFLVSLVLTRYGKHTDIFVFIVLVHFWDHLKQIFSDYNSLRLWDKDSRHFEKQVLESVL